MSNRPSPVTDALYAHQERMIKEYECYQCGRVKPGSELEDRTYFDQGERFDVQICNRCIRLGWDKWGRP